MGKKKLNELLDGEREIWKREKRGRETSPPTGKLGKALNAVPDVADVLHKSK